MNAWFHPVGLLPFLLIFIITGVSAAGSELRLLSAETRGNSNGLVVTYSAPVTAATATNHANYSIDHGVIVEEAERFASDKVRLRTSTIAEGRVYTLTASNLIGDFPPPNTMTPDSRISFLQTQGGITRREYHGISGIALSDLTNNANFPGAPDVTDFSTSFEAPVDVRDNYGMHFLGYITAPMSGDYVFYMASDDEGALYLSTDENPANKQLIASEPQWNSSRTWQIGPNQSSRFKAPPAEFFEDALFIEAEDFNFGGGQYVQDQPIGMSGAYSGGAYAEFDAVVEIDYYDPGANENVVYRSSSQGVAMVESGESGRGSFEVLNNFRVGWNDAGDWYNYTRHFSEPAREYHVYARLSSGGAPIAAELAEVTAGASSTSQTTVTLGEFRSPATGDYGRFATVPLLTVSGEQVRVQLGGERTLRFTVLPGSLDVDYLVFKPADSDTTDITSFGPSNRSRAIHLQAGGKYYVEALMKEGGGGDNLAVAWKKPGDPEPSNGDPPIPGKYLSGLGSVDAVTITQSPSSQAIDECGTVSFFVGHTGTPPFDYQWYRNGQIIPVPNEPALTLGPLSYLENGDVFHVMVLNGVSSQRSADAVLTVVLDLTAPTLSRAEGSPTMDRVTVHFSERVNPSDAEHPGNYRFSGGVSVTGAQLLADGRTVRLSTSPQIAATNYTLTVSNVRDLASAENSIAPETEVSFRTFVLMRGFLQREIYLNLPGSDVASLTNSSQFRNSADALDYVTSFESPFLGMDEYGVRLSGFIMPPVTGEYVFYIGSDDQGALFLSTDDQPANLRRIAAEPGWSPMRQWRNSITQNSRGNPAVNVSEPIHLEAGNSYYIEARMKEGGGGDHLEVTWQMPGQSPPDEFSLPISGEFLASYAEPNDADVSIVRQPENVAVTESQRATFEVRAIGSPGPLFYQWQRNGLDIPHANSPSYTTPPLLLADSGAQYRCVVSVPGNTAYSAESILTVNTDTQPPAVISVGSSYSLTVLTVEFSEPVHSTDATNTTHYALNLGLTVERARLREDGKTVVLRTSPQEEGQEYRLTVGEIRDLSSSGNPMPAQETLFYAWEPEEFVGPFPSWVDAKRDFGAVGDGITDDTAALQQALDNIGGGWTDSPSHVLYIPAGTYRITGTLNFFTRLSASIIGEHPDSTILKWDGAAEGVMLWINGVTYSRFGRITFDGSGRANSGVDHKWDTQRDFASVGNEFADMVFKDLRYGIRAGVLWNDSEVAVLRCRFLRCSEIGISMESFNALDWWIWHSVFEDCRYGVANLRGAGHFHVYDSIFRRSTESDLAIGHTQYFGIRRNTSIGSRRFLEQGYTGNPCAITLQDNTILDPIEQTSITIQSMGPLMLFDNVVRSRAEHADGPVVSAPSLICVGNVFTSINALSSSGSVIAINNRVVPTETIEATEPVLPGVLPNRRREIFEVPSGATPTEIQATIDLAATRAGTRPVVHLPKGRYEIDRTLVVPAGTDVQIVGDGLNGSSTLAWVGIGPGPVLHLAGPSKATLREFSVDGAYYARGIVVDQCDQPGARVFAENLNAYSATVNNLLLDRLDETDVSLHDSHHVYSSGISARIIGGRRKKEGEQTRGRMALFGGLTASSAVSYQVEDGAFVLVQDTWYEGWPPGFLLATNSGTIVFNGAVMATLNGLASSPPDAPPALDVRDHRGNLVLVGVDRVFSANTRLRLSGDGSHFNLLLLGVGSAGPFLDNQSPEARFTEAANMNWTGQAWNYLPDTGDMDSDFLLRMIEPIRTVKPRPLVKPAPGVTDLRMHRIMVTQTTIGIQLGQSNAPPAINPISDLTVHEGEPIRIAVEVEDADSGYNQLTFRLAGDNPPGATIDSRTGVFTWTPGASLGTATYQIRVVVEDGGAPPQTVETSFRVTVFDDSEPPAVAAAAFAANPFTDKSKIGKDSLSPDWLNAPGHIRSATDLAGQVYNYFTPDEEAPFLLRSRTTSRDQEVDVSGNKFVTYLRLTDDGTAIQFSVNYFEGSSGNVRINIVRGVDESQFYERENFALWETRDLDALLPEGRKTPSTDYFTFGIEGFEIYAKWNGIEFLRFKEYRHMRPGAIGFKLPGSLGVNGVVARFKTDKFLLSDYRNLVLDLRDFGLRSAVTTGSIASGSNLLQLDAAPVPPFIVGDWIIVETGGEAGEGARGTLGVGGSWPRLRYPNASGRDIDNSQPLNTYCWLESDGSVWQWDGTVWQDRAHFVNEVGGITEDWYVAKAVPKALRAVITSVSPDGLMLTLDEPAATATTNAVVHFDNSPMLNRQTVWIHQDQSALTPAGLTLYVPPGEFAIGDALHLAVTNASLIGAGTNLTRLFSPRGTPSASIRLYYSPGARLADLRLEGNMRSSGFGFASGNPRLGLFPEMSETSTFVRHGFGAIQLINCTGGIITNVLVVDTSAPNVVCNNSSNALVARVYLALTEPNFSQSVIIYVNGCSDIQLEDVTIDSARLSLGVYAQYCPGMQVIRLDARNAFFSLGLDGGSFIMRDSRFSFTPQAQEGRDGWASTRNPIVRIGGPTPEGSILENITMSQPGVLNNRGEVLPGIVLGTDNAQVIGGSYTAPDYVGSTQTGGAPGLISEGRNVLVERFRVSGQPRDYNIYLNHGVITNSWADVIRVDPPALLVNSWTDSNLAPMIGLFDPGFALQLTNSQNIGTGDNPAEPGSTLVLPGGSVEMIAGGAGVGAEDHVRFAFQEIIGDFDVSVRIADQTFPDSRAGLMVRQSLSNNSRQVSFYRHPSWGAGGSYRQQDGQSISSWSLLNNATSPQPNSWIRLRRTGNQFTAFTGSTHGWIWLESGQVTLPEFSDPESGSVYLGLFATSEDNGAGRTTRALFQDLRMFRLPPSSMTAVEGSEILVDFNGSDFNHPADQLKWSLGAGAPKEASIDPETGLFRWLPTRADAPSTIVIPIVLTDNGVPPLATTHQLTLYVSQINDPPRLSDIPVQVVPELNLFQMKAVATDANEPAQQLTFALTQAPEGMEIDSATGVITWTPSEGQGATNYLIGVQVSDGGSPPLIDAKEFTIVVEEVNLPPKLTPDFQEAPAIVSTFTGGDPGEGLDLEGVFVYSVNVGPDGAADRVGDSVFTSDSVEGVALTARNAIPTGSWGAVDYGLTDNDKNLSFVMNSIRWSPAPEVLSVRLAVEKGALYKLQILEHEDSGPGRGFNIVMNGQTEITNFMPGRIQAGNGTEFEASKNSVGVVITKEFVASGSTFSFDLDGAAADSPDINNHDAILNGFTLERIIATEILDQIIEELSQLTLNVTGTDADVPADTLVFSLGADAPAGASIDSASGAFTWTPSEAQGPKDYDITVIVTDSNPEAVNEKSLSASSTFQVTVQEVNQGPVLATIADATINEQTALTFTAIATDADVPANTLTFSFGVDAPAGASIDPASGAFTWTPTEAQGPSTNIVTVRVTDNGTPPLSDTRELIIVVTETNAAPALTLPGDQIIDEMQPFSTAASATDTDLPAQALAFALVEGPTGMTVNSSGVIAWTPAEEQGPGTHLVTIRVFDNSIPSLSATQSFSIVVNEVNRVPVLPAIANQTLDEGTTLTITNTADDFDLPANTLNFTLLAGPSGASLDPATGVLTWTPTEAQGPGTNLVRIKVTDDGVPSLSATNEFTIIVNEVNAAPVLTPIANQVVDEHQILNFSVSASDPNDEPPNAVALSVGEWPEGATFDPVTGQFNWTPSETQQGVYSITFTATDNGVPPFSDSQILQITVNEMNTSPVLTPMPDQTVAELQTLLVTNVVTDADLPANTLTFALLAGPGGASLDPATGVLTWTPIEAQGPSTNAVRIKVTDDGVPSLSATNEFTIIVNEVNATPVLAPIANQVVDEHQFLSFSVSASDPNDEPPNSVMLSAGGLPEGATFDPASGQFNWTPSEAQQGVYSITFTATDNGVPPFSDSQILQITVNEMNTSPVLTPMPDQTVAELQTLIVTNITTDTDLPANTLSFTLLAGPGGASLDPATGVLTWTPIEAQGPGTNLVRIKVTDDGVPSLSATNEFTIIVNEVNATPVLAPIANQVVDEHQLLSFSVSASDPNDEPPNSVMLSAGGLPEGATFDPASGQFNWTPSEAQQGVYSVTVTAIDDGAPTLSATNEFTITVQEVNSAPVLATVPDQTVAELQTLIVTNVAVDADLPANTLSFVLLASPAGAILDPATGVLTWTPSETEGPGTNLIQIKVSDSGAPSLSATNEFTVYVLEVNEQPSFVAGSDLVVNEDAGPQMISQWAALISTGPPGDAGRNIEFTVSVDRQTLFLDPPTLSSAGTLTFTPAPDANGIASATVRLRDDGGTEHGGQDRSQPQTFTITIRPVNDAPSFVKGLDQAVEAGAGSKSVPAWATAIRAGPADELGQLLGFELTTDRSMLFLEQPTLSPDGLLRYTPATNTHGIAEITVRLSDDGGTERGGKDTSLTQTFFIEVTRSYQLKLGPATVSPDGTLVLRWQIRPAKTYRVQFKSNLGDADWSDLPAAPGIEGADASVSISTRAGSQSFFRIIETD